MIQTHCSFCMLQRKITLIFNILRNFDIFIPFFIRSIIFFSYPVDSKTPIGYLIAGSIQVVTNIIAALVLTITLILHAGMCLFACDMITDLEEDLRQLDEKYIKKRTNQSINGSTLGAFIRSHFEAVQLSYFSLTSVLTQTNALPNPTNTFFFLDS